MENNPISRDKLVKFLLQCRVAAIANQETLYKATKEVDGGYGDRFYAFDDVLRFLGRGLFDEEENVNCHSG